MKKNHIDILGKQVSTDDFFTLRLGEYQKNHADWVILTYENGGWSSFQWAVDRGLLTVDFYLLQPP